LSTGDDIGGDDAIAMTIDVDDDDPMVIMMIICIISILKW